MRRLNTFIGSPLERVEDFRFLRGRGQYVDDLARPGQWHAAIVRSQVAHGRIRSIDIGAALAMPGVRAVLTAADIGPPIPIIPFRRPIPRMAPYAQPVIAHDKVRYVGEPIALVLADMMGLPATSVDYIEYDVGGGFGARGEFYPEDFLVAFAARKFGHPVKWVEDRREHFLSIAHSRECDADIEIALDRDGTMLGLRGDVWCDIGAYVRPNGMTPVRNVAQFTSG